MVSKHACTFTWLLRGDIPPNAFAYVNRCSFFFWYDERIDEGDSCITTTIEWDVHNEAHGSCVAT